MVLCYTHTWRQIHLITGAPRDMNPSLITLLDVHRIYAFLVKYQSLTDGDFLFNEKYNVNCSHVYIHY